MWLWQRSLVKLMTSPDGSTLAAAEPSARRSGGDASGSGLFSLFPEGRTGPVMQRSLRYVVRDPKTKASWVTALAIGMIVPVLNAVQGSGSVYFACFAAGMLGMQMYNQFGQDTSAFWMVALSVSSTRDAYLELRARALALLLITLPYTVLVTVVTAAVLGSWTALPGAMGLSFALLGAMLATGALASAQFPYSIPQDGAFKNVVPGQAGLAWISIFGGMIAAAVLSGPVIALTIWLHVADHQDQLWLLLPVGAVYGAFIGWLGVRLAAPRAAGRPPGDPGGGQQGLRGGPPGRGRGAVASGAPGHPDRPDRTGRTGRRGQGLTASRSSRKPSPRRSRKGSTALRQPSGRS